MGDSGPVTNDIAAGSPASDAPAHRRIRRRSRGAGGMGQPLRRPGAAVERPAQRRARRRGRRAHARAGARRRLRRGRGRRLARQRRLGRDRAGGLGGGAGAGGRACAGRRCRHPLGARRTGRGGAPAGVLRPRLRAVPGPAAHPRRRGRAGAARRRRARRRAAARAPRGDGHPAGARQRLRPGRLRLALDGRPRCSTTTGRSRWTSSGRGSSPDGGAGAHHVDDLVLRAAGCAEDAGTRSWPTRTTTDSRRSEAS